MNPVSPLASINSGRRTFLRVVGGTALLSPLAPPQLFGAKGKGPNGVLVEACGFSDKGGWSLDTQHYHQMGGNHLLAHVGHGGSSSEMDGKTYYDLEHITTARELVERILVRVVFEKEK